MTGGVRTWTVAAAVLASVTPGTPRLELQGPPGWTSDGANPVLVGSSMLP